MTAPTLDVVSLFSLASCQRHALAADGHEYCTDCLIELYGE